MAIAFHYMEKMADLGLLVPNKTHLLDIGCSNLYEARPENVVAFMQRFGASDSAMAEELAARSQAKTAFAGELFVKCSIEYDAIDIAPDFRTTRFDLNNESLPQQFRGACDLVLNFGTTEHVMNQANAFEVIHDAAKIGGHIYHQLPAAGFSNHGYFTYTGRFFFDLAGYNGYEVVACWFDQASDSDLMAPVRDYTSYFSALSQTQPCKQTIFPDTVINIIYRKVNGNGFKYPLEFSTSYRKPQVEATMSRLKSKLLPLKNLVMPSRK